jgi:UDP-glucose 6-dehydrogenase
MSEIRFGVIGLGIVGSCYYRWLKQYGYVASYDKKGDGSIDDVNAAEVVFVCVNTPFDVSDNLMDTSYIVSSIKCLSGSKSVVICSTVPIGFCKSLSHLYPQHKIFHNPEFLRAKSAWEDFCNPCRQVIGITKEELRSTSLIDYLPQSKPFIVQSEVSELIKLSSNLLLAVRVAAAHKVIELGKSAGVEECDIKDILSCDSRIGAYGLNTLEQRGYSGRCFPKDVRTFIAECKRNNISCGWLEAMDDANCDLLKVQGIDVDYGYPAEEA